jgi:hypothetical protein
MEEEEYMIAEKLEELRWMNENLRIYEEMRCDFDKGGMTLL